MSRGMKRASITLLIGIGVIVALVGAFTDFYGFVPSGLIGMVSAWVLAGVIKSFWYGTAAEP